MNDNLKNKIATTQEIKEKIGKSKSVVFVNYQGTSVEKDTALRNEFRKNNAEYKVFKNRLIMRALDELGYNGYTTLEGTTAVAFGYDDEIVPARLISEAMKNNDKMTTKYGIMNGQFINADKLAAISKLPSKEVLISQLLSVLNGPISGLARALKAVSEKN